MEKNFISCPKCGVKIPLTEAITHQIGDQLRSSIEAEYAANLARDKKAIEKTAKKKAQEELALEMKDKDEQLKEKTEQLKTAQDKEIELRKKTREIEEREENQKLEMERKLDEERKKIKEETSARVEEEYRLKERQKDLQLDSMRTQIEDLKRKAEQGSQQAQGEALELELEDLLRQKFPFDAIEPVPKGMKGADVLQTVNNALGHYCGTIIWESKRTKNWSNDWITKLKDDQRAAKADVAVITSIALPKDSECICENEGVWVTDYSSCIGLASALRQGLLDVAKARSAQVGKSEKMEIMYNYISGPEFRRRVEAFVEPFLEMQKDLAKERRAMEKLWAKREKQISRVLLGTAGMYGDLEGIVGTALPSVEMLELAAPVEEESDA